MDGNHVVHEISSDEDDTFDWPSTEGRDNDNFDWSNLMVNLKSGTSKDQKSVDKGYDSDDVVIVREVLANPKRAKKAPVVSKLVAQDLEDDDDCVMLDGDPDKIVAVEGSGPNLDGDSDDVVVVGEKGPVACRDYPHARHLCVKLPFDSSLHSEYCTQCHCYVCDSPAPCDHWGNGNLMIDHCHASDKEELWNSERKRAKLEKRTTIAKTSYWRNVLQQIPTPPSVPAQNSGTHSSLPAEAPSFGIPNIIRSHRTAGVSARHPNLIKPCSNPQRAIGTSLGYTSHTSILKRTNRPSYNKYRNAFAANLAGIRQASAQASVRHLHEFQTGGINGEVNLNTLKNSSESSVCQTASLSMPVQPFPQRLAPVSSTTAGSTSHVQPSTPVQPCPQRLAPVSCTTAEKSKSRFLKICKKFANEMKIEGNEVKSSSAGESNLKVEEDYNPTSIKNKKEYGRGRSDEGSSTFQPSTPIDEIIARLRAEKAKKKMDDRLNNKKS